MSFDDRRLLDLALRNDLSSFIHRTYQTVAPAQTFHPNWPSRRWLGPATVFRRKHQEVADYSPAAESQIDLSVGRVSRLGTRTYSYGSNRVCELFRKSSEQACAGLPRRSWSPTGTKEVFPNTRIGHAKNTELNYVTTLQGSRYSTSVGGTLTGRGGNILIIDDPLKPEDAFSESKRSR